jgi:hypothetical protein
MPVAQREAFYQQAASDDLRERMHAFAQLTGEPTPPYPRIAKLERMNRYLADYRQAGPADAFAEEIGEIERRLDDLIERMTRADAARIPVLADPQ